MTQYEQLKMLYNQLINLTTEEDKLVEAKAYDEVLEMFTYKAKLIKRVVILKRTVEFTPAQAVEFSEMEKKYKQNEEKNIKKFTKIRDELDAKRKNTRKNIKLKSAYAKTMVEKQGSMLDLSE